MSEEMLVRFCAPTLAGLKTGNLISCRITTREEIICEVQKLNREVVPKGVCIIPLSFTSTRALIYVFRPKKLKQDLSEKEIVELLKEAGYQNVRAEECLLELMHRLKIQQDFPHEIGLFLSYPIEDVRGFIQNHAGNFKCVGCWKVYGDEYLARKRFAMYEKCTEVYYRQWKHGKTINQLTVSAK